MSFPVRIGVALVLGLVGCGGTVVFDEIGGDGAGGSSAADTLCATSCDAYAACTDDVPECVRTCELQRAYAGRCKPQVDAFYVCGEQSTDICKEIPAGCEAQVEAVNDCWLPPGDCTRLGCENDAGTNRCEDVCGPHDYVRTCTDGSCTCSVDGTVVGTCDDELTGAGFCCAQFFAETDGG